MSEDKNNDRFLVGLIIGSSISTIVTLLFHPDSGVKNRQKLRQASEKIPELTGDLSANWKTYGRDLFTYSRKQWSNTVRRVQVAIDAGMQAAKVEAQAQRNQDVVTVKGESVTEQDKVDNNESN